MQKKEKKIINTIFYVLISICFMLTLCFNIIRVSISGESVKENGFKMLDFNSAYFDFTNNCEKIVGILSIFILILSIIFIILSLLSCFYNEKVERIFKNVLSIVVFSFSLTYLFVGLIYKDALETYLGDDVLDYGLEITTGVVVPIFIQIFLYVTMLIVNVLLDKNIIKSKNRNMSSSINKLIEYKKLLDLGLISQEEFAIKKSILISDNLTELISDNQSKENTENVSAEVQTLISFKKMLNDGLMTQEEFDKIKKEILSGD